MARQRTTITVDQRIWRRFKAVLAMEGKDLSAVVEELCEVYSNEHEAEARQAVEPSRER